MSYSNQAFDVPPSQSEEAETDTNSISKLLILLRVLGAAAVVISLSLFLLDGWSDGNDLQRYIKLLGQTSLITGAGIFLTVIFKETKGARVFFALGLVSLSALFTIQGALIYSSFQFDSALSNYPAALQWQSSSNTTVALLALLTLGLSALLARFSFSVFIREFAPKMTTLYLMSNMVLLIPIREPGLVAVILGVATVSLLVSLKSIVKAKSFTHTAEAIFSIALLFLPTIIIAARSISLYAFNELIVITIVGSIHVVLRYIASISTRWKSISLFLMLMTAAVLSANISSLIPIENDSWKVLIFIIAFHLFILENHRHNAAVTKGATNGFAHLVQMMLMILIIICAFIWSTVSFSVVAILTATFMMVSYRALDLPRSFKKQNLVIGLLACGIFSFQSLKSIFNLFEISPWLVFGLCGVGLIMLASIFERKNRTT